MKSHLKLVKPDTENRAVAPRRFGKFIGNETEKWAKVIKFAGIKPD